MYNINLSSQMIVILLIVITLVLVLLLYSDKNQKIEELKKIKVSINGTDFHVEVADSSSTREKGLMDRKSLDENAGMLFVFDKSFIYPFWMKNTYIPLDILWLNDKKEIVYIKKDAQPCQNTINALCNSIVPTKPAKYVVEFNSGTVDKFGFTEGDRFEFDL